jgi:cell division protein FtsW (lipid II flippase)
MAKGQKKSSKSTSTRKTHGKSKASPKVARTLFPTGPFWFLALTAFFIIALLPLITDSLTENPDLSSAFLAPLAIWGVTAIIALWFTRPSQFKGDRLFVVLTLLLFGLGIVEQLRLGSFKQTWEIWRGYAPMLGGAVSFLFCLRVLTANRLERMLTPTALKWILWLGIMGVLGALLCFGRSYRGGMFLPGQINPTELVKIFAVLLGATLLPHLKEGLSRHLCGIPWPTLPSLFQLAFFWGAPLVGVVLVRDLGLLLILCLTFVVMLTSITRNPMWLLLGIAGAAGAGLAICQISAHTATRFAIWMDPFKDPLGKGYQILQSLCAMNAGSLSGTGLNRGMPGSVPIVTSDFVYAAIAEEWGLIGCALLLVVYLFWVRCIFRTASLATSTITKLASVGIGAVLAVQIILNIGGVTKALPMTGITLPFLSHGGFSLLAVFILCGLAAALSNRD